MNIMVNPTPEQQYQQEIETQADLQDDQGWTPTQSIQTPELTRWQLSPDEILEFIEHELRGEDFDYSKNRWIQKSTPILNEEGIRFIVSKIRRKVNKITFLSNLDEQIIYEMMLGFSQTLTQEIFNNGEAWGIDWNKGHQNSIVDDVCDMVFIALRKALAQGERKFLGSHTKIMHRIDETPSRQVKEKKFGLF